MSYKSEIVKNMLQVARLRNLGYFLDDRGFMNIVGGNDVDMYAENFLREAEYNARLLLMQLTSTEDYDDD